VGIFTRKTLPERIFFNFPYAYHGPELWC